MPLLVTLPLTDMNALALPLRTTAVACLGTQLQMHFAIGSHKLYLDLTTDGGPSLTPFLLREVPMLRQLAPLVNGFWCT